MVFLCDVLDLEGGDGVLDLYHDVVSGILIEVIYLKVTDVLEVKEQTPFKHLSLWACQDGRGAEVGGGGGGGGGGADAVRHQGDFLLELNQLGFRHDKHIAYLADF